MEKAILFQAGGEELLGILHPGNAEAAVGVLVLVGGPQYRVGSHRQFLLLARQLAGAGVPTLRFDYRGMGDSTGDQRDFERVGDDIRAAINVFQVRCPHLREIVIWGLCDAASAALIYAWQDERVSGLALLNPWVRTEEGLAKAYLKRYYLQRLFSRDFWQGLVQGRFKPLASLRSLASMLRRGTGIGRQLQNAPAGSANSLSGPLPERMAMGWKRYAGPILLILSGDDLTAAEFRDTATTSPPWRGLLEQPRVMVRELPEANHTFARKEWRDQVAQWTLDWVLRR